MIKRITLIKRKPGVSRDEFFEYWRGAHADLTMQIPEVRGYVLNFVEEGAEWDGVGELWFDDMQAANRVLTQGETAARIAEDRRRFQSDEMRFYYALEHVLIRPPSRRD